MRSKMWNEIQDQYEVSKKIFSIYADKMSVYHAKLKEKKRLILIGTGASLNACKAAAYAFQKYSPFIPYIKDAYEIDFIVDKLEQDTLVILVSQSGNSYETKVISNLLKARGIEFWGITNNPESELARMSSETLLLHCSNEVSSATKTYMATVLLLYMLAVAGNKEASEKLAQLPSDIRRTLETCESVTPLISEKLKSNTNIYIAGMGMHGPVAGQAALLMKEKTFIHTEGMPISELRHGTIEVIQPGLPVVISYSSGFRMKEALLHIEFLMSIGAEVYVVADIMPEGSKIKKENMILISNNQEEVFSHLIAGIPFQLLAERIAYINGYDVDGFRFLKKVVDRY